MTLTSAHHHLVVLLQSGTLDDAHQRGDITFVGGIAAPLDGSSPATVVVGGKAGGMLAVALRHEDFGMVLIALPHTVVFLELLVGPVVIRQDIVAVVGTFHAEVVVGGIGQGAPAVRRLNDTLCQRHRGGYAIASHLLHGILRILLDILLSGWCHSIGWLSVHTCG